MWRRCCGLPNAPISSRMGRNARKGCRICYCMIRTPARSTSVSAMDARSTIRPPESRRWNCKTSWEKATDLPTARTRGAPLIVRIREKTMRLIDKLIFKDLIGPFLYGLAMFMLLVFAIGYLFQATDLLLQGIGFAIVFKLVVFSLPEVVTQTFPMAMLLGSLLAFGRLSADHEAVAMFAAGVSFPRMVRVVALAGAVISVIAFLWNDYVVPPAKSAYWDLRQEAVMHLQKSDRPLSYTIEDKDNNTGVEEFVSINGGYDAPSRTLRRVSIIKYSHDPNRRGQIEAEIYCDHAIAKDQQGLDWNYYQGYLILYVPAKETGKIESSSIIDFDELKSSPRTPSPGKNFEGVMNADIIDSNRKSFRDLRA